MLDPRRTPVTIVAVRTDVGFFTMRVDAFEDAGAFWDIPFEEVDRYQFERQAKRADPSAIAEYLPVVERLDRHVEIECDLDQRRATAARLEVEQRQAETWLEHESSFFAAGGNVPAPEQRRGDPRLYGDLMAYMSHRQVDDIEAAFSRQYVSHPRAGEVVKGHRIVLAQMGLAPYTGKIVRDPATFESPWDRARRIRHIEARLGFVRAMFARLGHSDLTLYRGTSMTEPVDLLRSTSFVSWTFSRTVAESHFDTTRTGVQRMLLARDVPVDRVFMTYLETSAMNDPFEEAEAVLLFDPKSPLF